MEIPPDPLADLVSPRTKKYLEAMAREGDSFDYLKWLQRVRQEEARARAVFALGDSLNPSASNPQDTGLMADRPPSFPKRSLPRRRLRTGVEARSETPEARLRRGLVKASNAWDDYQDSRGRDAVYGYLKAVFSLVQQNSSRRQTKRLVNRAYRFAGLPADDHPDPFHRGHPVHV
jgi:hypothetical protein